MMAAVDGREQFLGLINVSRETLERLDIYAALLKKWNPAINLVGKSTIQTLWTRHFLDSAQVFRISKANSGHWVDIGTGGGFPGLVVAAMAKDATPEIAFTFVESDLRKATFLRTAAMDMGLAINVVSKRIEDIPSLSADVLSARALASVTDLLGYAEHHLNPKGRALFLKGATVDQEVTEALETWSFQSEEYRSMTETTGVILSIGDIRRV